MRLKSYQWALIAIFLLTFAARAYIAAQTPLLSDDSSYFVLRQVEHISKTGLPIYNDSLSYGGRTLLFSSLFHYVLSIVYFIFRSVVALKIFLNLAASFLVLGAYKISDEITKSRSASLLTSLVAGFIPIFFQKTVNSLSILSISLPLMFFSLYYLIKLNQDKRYSTHFSVCYLLLIVLTPASIILILGLLFFLILVKIEKLKLKKENYEVILVSTFLYLWFNFILYKKAILFHGQNIIRQNIPQTYLLQYFSEINIIQGVYLIGIIPFFFGIYSSYVAVTKRRTLQESILLGVVFSLFFLLWFKLIPLTLGLIFLGGILVLMLAVYFKSFLDYISRTRFDVLKSILIFGIIAIIILASVLPSISLGEATFNNVPSEATVQAYGWLIKNSENSSVVLASENSGHALAYFSGRKNVMDNHFLFIKNIDIRLNDLRRIYITRFSQEAVELCSKYNIDYVLIDKQVRKDYGIDNLYYTDNECFNLVYDADAKIYEFKCKGELI